MDQTGAKGQSLGVEKPDYQEAWEMVLGDLQTEMSRALYETWVQPLRPVGYPEQDLYTVGAYNTYGRAWVEERLSARITRLLEGLYTSRSISMWWSPMGFTGRASRPALKNPSRRTLTPRQ